LTNLEEGDVLFIDEIHRLNPAVEEVLYPAMEDYQLDIMVGEGPAARSIKIDLPPFTLVGATTRAGLLTSPLRDRFGIVQRLEFYNIDDLAHIVARSGRLMELSVDEKGAREIARRARGTPRIANRLLRRVRDYAQVKGDGTVNHACADAALNMLSVDAQGFDHMDRRLLLTLLEKYDGGPAGVDSLAASIGEERDTIEDAEAGGMVYYANYLRYLERARTEWLRTLGLAQEKFRQDDILIAVRDVQLRYRAPAKLDDELIATVVIEKHRRTGLTLQQQV